jgi:methylated-DNA-[protein]-cysteine S-methyltransferase
MCGDLDKVNDPDGEEISAFAARIYALVRLIPPGKVTTYSLVAKAAGCRSPRAVGQALAGNPFAPQVPCHRVVAADLTIGGFCGRRAGPEVARKRRMLVREGVAWKDGRLADSGLIFRFDKGVAKRR